jgi:hypothetical protein
MSRRLARIGAAKDYQSGKAVPEGTANRRVIMGAFLTACVVAVVVAIAAGVVLDNFVQESSAAAFTRPSARI